MTRRCGPTGPASTVVGYGQIAMPGFSVQTLRAFVPEETRPYESALAYPSVFSDRQCDRIIEQAAGLASDAAHVGGGDGETEHDDGIRRSSIAWIPAEEPFVWIHDKLAEVVRRANRRYGFDLIGFTEDLQFTEYEGAGAFYTWHQDGLDGDLAARKLSMVVQLSDGAEYEGGELEFFAVHGDGADVSPEWRSRGTVVVFPAFEFHRVTPLLAGTRRSLVCWVGGPPFR
jgi:PKHD-type hydroxylase